MRDSNEERAVGIQRVVASLVIIKKEELGSERDLGLVVAVAIIV